MRIRRFDIVSRTLQTERSWHDLGRSRENLHQDWLIRLCENGAGFLRSGQGEARIISSMEEELGLMQQSLLKSTLAVLIIMGWPPAAHAKEALKVAGMGNSERIVVFAVQQEVEANNIRARGDLCIGFGYGLGVNRKAILQQLRQNGLRIHSSSWCDGRLR